MGLLSSNNPVGIEVDMAVSNPSSSSPSKPFQDLVE